MDIVAVGKERKAMGLTVEDEVETLDKSGSSDDDEVLELECIEVRDSDSKLSLLESE